MRSNFAVMMTAILLSTGAVRAGDAIGAYRSSMDRMNADIKIGMEDSDPTRSWAKMMVAHHHGATVMSRTVLEETKDPIIRRMPKNLSRGRPKSRRRWRIGSPGTLNSPGIIASRSGLPRRRLVPHRSVPPAVLPSTISGLPECRSFRQLRSRCGDTRRKCSALAEAYTCSST
ncbi:MAG: DUF305 domain-containing protein [Rhodopseudomonas palustris]|uniref:DUF305 domain-containing protein n=1 Tax=Rhodopseudomonas palustris TaxID=1076 RepID=A0A933VUM7_RHOPL|nr:DUF305 domain-containing protein [Rhodopseudomonas palustris]